jgi:hypothetical protein
MDRSNVAENEAERERLRALVRRLSDQDLAGSMDAGWTVAGVLAHVAFWDQRILVLLDAWERQGPLLDAAVGRRVMATGSTMRRSRLPALPPRVAADLAVSVAETIDRRVAAVSDAIIEANARIGASTGGAPRPPQHPDEIERMLRRV